MQGFQKIASFLICFGSDLLLIPTPFVQASPCFLTKGPCVVSISQKNTNFLGGLLPGQVSTSVSIILGRCAQSPHKEYLSARVRKSFEGKFDLKRKKIFLTKYLPSVLSTLLFVVCMVEEIMYYQAVWFPLLFGFEGLLGHYSSFINQMCSINTLHLLTLTLPQYEYRELKVLITF